MTKLQKLQDLLAPIVEALEFQCWGVEFISQGRHSVLRIYIEHENGITVDNCELVSRQLSAVLDVEDPVSGEYTLEVSSPGMDRPLFTLEQYAAYVGQQVKIKLRAPVEERRHYQGMIRGIEEDDVVVQVDSYEYLLPFELIEKANIVPNY
ncbi:MAG: ribosome maturation factor RimP [Thiopseudomonas sp.]|nr:ribosome maturation factor RimP [Thiopseudomonas sp.]MCK9466046.1 ribosome maturation factor RimP [Thiopseudomonas sp.]